MNPTARNPDVDFREREPEFEIDPHTGNVVRRRDHRPITLKRLLWDYGALWWGPLLAVLLVGMCVS